MPPYAADDDAGVVAYWSDCLTHLRSMPDCSVHAVITDPPYGLADHKPERVIEALTAWASGDRERVPAGKGFMGRAWDAFVPPPAVWDECLRVLVPGGHLAVFAGSRTVDLMGLSIRLAGFEMRDGIAAWVYGSGFPKSLDVGKAIDKQRDDRSDVLAVTSWLAAQAAAAGITRAQVDAHMGTVGMAGHWMTTASQPAAPTIEQWEQLRALLGFSPEMDAEVWRLNGRKGTPGEAWTGREIIGAGRSGAATVAYAREGAAEYAITTAAQDASREWQGWGTSLKPAHEPILLARKPLRGTVAGNVLAHGAGGINIDACRVGDDTSRGDRYRGKAPGGGHGGANYSVGARDRARDVPPGRWPSNALLAHHPDCGPDEAPGPCVDGCQVAALDAQSGIQRDGVAVNRNRTERKPSTVGYTSRNVDPADVTYGGGGGASRYFPTFRYCAKAPKRERPIVDGRGHPTVKPLGLMRWLTRLLCPPGGTVLDPFAGSGSTLEAAQLEGFRAIGIEADEHSCRLIAERLARSTPVEEPPALFA